MGLGGSRDTVVNGIGYADRYPVPYISMGEPHGEPCPPAACEARNPLLNIYTDLLIYYCSRFSPCRVHVFRSRLVVYVCRVVGVGCSLFFSVTRSVFTTQCQFQWVQVLEILLEKKPREGTCAQLCPPLGAPSAAPCAAISLEYLVVFWDTRVYRGRDYVL